MRDHCCLLVLRATRRHQRRAMHVIFETFERELHKYGKYLDREKIAVFLINLGLESGTR